ncbi:hypothetical protein BFJ72_g6676 [Fusarium proliferatum]|uniref:Uncharacterized protein n=1 Tax=Gibberella intermedia TaxID=948311 RepID=A0A420TEL4_GIBIN|nr:hypothetical protein BFJ72_g6676 [Fusarium proliferatum]
MTNTLIGSRAWSRVYHADDEVMAHDMNSSIWEYNAASDRTMNCKFGPDDAVGCGVEYSKGLLYLVLLAHMEKHDLLLEMINVVRKHKRGIRGSGHLHRGPLDLG